MTLLFFCFSQLAYFGDIIFNLNSFPFIDIFGRLGVFAFGALFSLLILFAFAAKYFLAKLCKKTRVFAFLIIFVVLTLEYLTVPYITTASDKLPGDLRTKTEVIETISGELKPSVPNDDRIVLVLPFLRRTCVNSLALYWQTLHERKIIGGYVSRANPESARTAGKLAAIIKARDLNRFHQFLKEHNVGYIIFNDHLRGIGTSYNEAMFLVWRTPRELVAEHRKGERSIYIFEIFPDFNINSK